MFRKQIFILVTLLMYLLVGAGAVLAAEKCDTWPVSEPQPAGAPAIPSNLQATEGDGQVQLSWDAVTGADGYLVVWTDCTASKQSDITDLDNQQVTTNSATVTGLTNGQTYQFAVKSYSGSGLSIKLSTESGVVAATPSGTSTTTTVAVSTTTGAVTTTTTGTGTTTTAAVSTTTVPKIPGINDLLNLKGNYDVNQDGEVNAMDAATIIRALKLGVDVQ
ncbi:MAG: fibronectin type III domain-containing protein [Desulfohalobiaceae bacterium]|nr:fibronectin type III domain-containing protein [Desulfohalobiaceae bacterium]